MCDGLLVLLGRLGNLMHFRCQDCGMQQSIPADELEEEDDLVPSLVLRYERDEISHTFQFGCMVETWDHVVGHSAAGSKRRKYHEAFTEAERKIISRYHTQFHRWHLVSGVPDHIYFRKPATVDLLKRAIQFFAEV